MKVVDLSHKLSNGVGNYPTDPPVIIKKNKNIDEDRTLLHEICFGTHSGTHMDAPSHIQKDGKTISDFNINSFMGNAIRITPNFSDSLAKIDAEIDTVIYDTRWYKKFDNPEIYFGKNRPKIPESLINHCLKLKIKIFGCDLPSVDKSGSKNKIIHNMLLGNDVLIYESLNNLEQIPENTIFKFFGFPLHFEDLDGSPVRAVGVLE